MISKSLVAEFQQIVKAECGKNITTDEASAIIRDLVGYFSKLAEIQHKTINGKTE